MVHGQNVRAWLAELAFTPVFLGGLDSAATFA
jgi:hypothetical protein